MDQLLNFMLDRKASDLHVSSDTTPIIRVDGDMAPVEGYPPLAPGRLKDMLFSIAPEKNREQWLQIKDTDFAYETPRARFRVNVFEDRKGIGAVLRQIPTSILHAPRRSGSRKRVLDLCFLHKGLVLVTGPDRLGQVDDARGDDRLHQPQPRRPHHHHRGPDRVRAPEQEVPGEPARGAASTPTRFKHALRAALREDPDIVLVGEMRDLETIAIAIETAETGHLVFGTLHTNTAPSHGRPHHRPVPRRPAGADPHHARRVAQGRHRADAVQEDRRRPRRGAGDPARAPARVANLIREGKTFQIPSIMQTGARHRDA